MWQLLLGTQCLMFDARWSVKGGWSIKIDFNDAFVSDRLSDMYRTSCSKIINLAIISFCCHHLKGSELGWFWPTIFHFSGQDMCMYVCPEYLDSGEQWVTKDALSRSPAVRVLSTATVLECRSTVFILGGAFLMWQVQQVLACLSLNKSRRCQLSLV